MSHDSEFILLGFVEPRDEVGDSINYKNIWRENFIGGEPVFSPNLPEDEFNSKLNQNQLSCDGCGSLVSFICQMSCPVDTKPIDRIIYIFSCVNVNCKKRKWIMVRVVTPLDDSEENGSEEPHHDESMELDDGSTRKGYPRKLAFSDKVNKFKAMYLSVEEAKDLDRVADIKGPKQKGGEIESGGNEVYEKFLIPGTDEVANKFLKTVSRFNRQVIRYSWDGKPLLNQNTKITVGQCSSCGAKKTFELQVMPGMIVDLKPKVDESTELDFGTVLFFTCKNNCNRDRHIYIEESIVLEDPDNEVMPKF